MTTISEESKIREIAYGLWEQEGKPSGRDLDHYFKAEQLVTTETSQPAGSSPTATAKPKASARAQKTTAPRARKAVSKKSAAK